MQAQAGSRARVESNPGRFSTLYKNEDLAHHLCPGNPGPDNPGQQESLDRHQASGPECLLTCPMASEPDLAQNLLEVSRSSLYSTCMIKNKIDYKKILRTELNKLNADFDCPNGMTSYMTYFNDVMKDNKKTSRRIRFESNRHLTSAEFVAYEKQLNEVFGCKIQVKDKAFGFSNMINVYFRK